MLSITGIANTLKNGNKEAGATKKVTILGGNIIDWELSKHFFCPATDCTKDYIKPSLKSSMLESLANPSNIIINVWINDSNQTIKEIASLTH